MDTIFKRRSIRRFTPEPVPQDVLIQFIKAGMNAPSAGNEQPRTCCWKSLTENMEECGSGYTHTRSSFSDALWI